MSLSLSSTELLAHLPKEIRLKVLREYQLAITDTMKTVVSEPAIANQFIPDERELNISTHELVDPIGDDAHSVVPFLVHRYFNRVLWKIVPTCAVYCRFCFRKEHIGRKGEQPKQEDIQAAHHYIAMRSEIEEVILSGGDPMTLSSIRLKAFVAALKDIPHIKRIRVHTRIPVVAPEMVKKDWIRVLEETEKNLVFVIHANHSAEFSQKSDDALAMLATKGLLLSQTVLLKSVNDSVEALQSLMNAFLERKIKPYYLHHLDLARGTQHFRLSLAEGIALYQSLRHVLSGIALPAYIVEIPGGEGKVPVLQLTDNQRFQLKQMGIS
ncbi:KamA family radical SAM protein [Suttonella ornithocola]|uniref:L-lysine 2,3-aminomutase n=2 Tax=Suttonella ornithocola TaxID=279832 RepID=A0A380MXW1_9GAMM|nr:KamA family radical SAM protein [Suttonella ornithocola]SUO97405.1 L-lysine 2,3-aminomutase [Suttonella ornithocola]